ncbi:MAG: ATP-binding protein, partial [Pseudomonadota bacterium]
RAEDLLIRSQSLAAIGTLGAGIAHEINNPLTGILGAAQLILLDLPPDAPMRALVLDMEQQAQRIRRIVANLSRVVQRETGEEKTTIDLNQVVEDALGLVGIDSLYTAKIEVCKRCQQPLPGIRGNRVQLQEALIELINNARKAMPGGGKLTVATSTPDPRIVSVRVSDTGRGIPVENLERIFDPFFTTKDDWKSTGMGLTLVNRIVEQHNGVLMVDSQTSSGSGTSFVVSFPVAVEPTVGAVH